MTEPSPAAATLRSQHAADLIAVVPACALVVTSWLTEGGPRGVFQADVAGLATIAAVGAFATRLRARPVALLALAAVLAALAHGVVGGGWAGSVSLGVLALGVGVGAAGLAGLGRAVGAPATAAGVLAQAVLIVAMLGMSWADPVGDQLPIEKRYAFKQAVVHLDAATACAYDAAGLDRFHDPSVYDRVALASGAVAPPAALPTGLFWLGFGLVTGFLALALRVAQRPSAGDAA